MSRLLATILSGALLGAAILLPSPPSLDPPDSHTGPVEDEVYRIGALSYCPWSLSDGARLSSYIAVANVPADLRLSFVEGGRLEVPLSIRLDPGGSGAVASVENQRLLGVSSALIEFDGSEGATAVVTTGDNILSGYLCPTRIQSSWHLPGGSTLDGEELVLRLLNPFTADARVDVWVLSELGSETDDRLEGLTIPARNTRIVVIDEVLPRRESLAVIVRSSTGAVIPVMALDRGTDRAVWAGAGSSQGWEFPVASVDGLDTALVLTNEGSLEVNYLVEFFNEEGIPSAPLAGVIEGPGQARVPLTDWAGADTGLRVTGDGLFSAAVVGWSATALAVTPGLPTNATTWLVPGLDTIGANTRLGFLNTGVGEVRVDYMPLGSSGEGGTPGSLTLPAASTATVTLSDPGTEAVIVSGDGPFTVGWWAESAGKVVFGGAVPGG